MKKRSALSSPLPASTSSTGGKPVGTVEDGDSVIFFNFRGDRSIEISKTFDAPAGEFDKFDRKRVPTVVYAGMLEYDGDLHIPHRYLVSPPEITNTMSEYLAAHRANGVDICIASGGGRMQVTMDRYEANWGMVELGWKTHVLGEGRKFASAKEEIGRAHV